MSKKLNTMFVSTLQEVMDEIEWARDDGPIDADLEDPLREIEVLVNLALNLGLKLARRVEGKE